LMFPNAVGRPLRRTLFRSRVWRPALVSSRNGTTNPPKLASSQVTGSIMSPSG
jgi:hypothetical protein